MRGERARRLARWFALAWAVGAWLVVPRLAWYAVVRTTLADGGASSAEARATNAEVNGPAIYVSLAVPIVAALLALLPFPPPFRRAAQVIGAAIAVAYVLLGMMTVGVIYLPVALALILGATPARRVSRDAA